MGRRKKWLRDFLSGSLIGAGAILPGVSGGVLAVIFDLYEPMMDLLTIPRYGLRQHGLRLVPVVIGMVIGFLIFAKGLLAFFQISHAVVVWAFIGMILGTMPALYRKGGACGRGVAGWGSMLLCGGVMLVILLVVRHTTRVQVTPNLWWNILCGFLLGVGVIVPGMATSGVLMALGLYEPMLNALAMLELETLLSYGCGLLAAVLLLARGVRWMFRKYYTVTNRAIIGIVMASAFTIIPTNYRDVREMVFSVICCAAGFFLALTMERLDSAMDE